VARFGACVYSYRNTSSIQKTQNISLKEIHISLRIIVYHQVFSTKNSLAPRIVVLEKALENPLDSKEIKPVSPKGNQS